MISYIVLGCGSSSMKNKPQLKHTGKIVCRAPSWGSKGQGFASSVLDHQTHTNLKSENSGHLAVFSVLWILKNDVTDESIWNCNLGNHGTFNKSEEWD